MADLQHLQTHLAGYPCGEIRYDSVLNLQPYLTFAHE